MKKTLVLSFLMLLPCWMEAQHTVTISQCYQWAEENYPRIRQYGLIDQTEKYEMANIGKSWLPQINMSAKLSHQSDVTKIPIDLSKLPGDMSIPTLSKNQFQAVAELSQTIWDGGNAGSQRALTKAEAELNRKQVQNELYTLKNRINQLYFGILLHKELIGQNSLLQKDLETNLERIRAMMANGMANESDKDLLEVELLNVRQRELELCSSCNAYIRMLSYFTGQEGLDKLDLVKPELPALSMSRTVNRPELESFQAQTALLDRQDKAISASMMPRIGAFLQAGYGRPGLNMLEDEFNPYYIAGIRMNWNLGRLYTVKNDRRKLDVARRNVDINRETFLFNTQLQLINQNEEIRKLAELMNADQDIMRLRSNVKKASEVKLENGVIAVSDLIRDINAEDMARQAAAIHQMEYLMAIYQLMYLTK